MKNGMAFFQSEKRHNLMLRDVRTIYYVWERLLRKGVEQSKV